MIRILTSWLVISSAISTCARAAESATHPARPNIIVILADDLGFSDLGCYGGEIATPNLDRLASRGVRFTQFYNAARCCPSRAALLTGLYPHQTGVGHMTDEHDLPGYRGTLNDRCVTIAEALRPAGYRTLMSGKWHVGSQRPSRPLDRGFEHYFGLLSGACSYFGLWPGRPMAVDNEPFVPGPGFYMTDAITDHAVSFINEYGGKAAPFFLHVAYTAPHAPLHAWPADIAKYDGKYDAGWDAVRSARYERTRRLGLIDASWALPPRDPDVPAWDDAPDKAAWARKMAVYAAQIDCMDRGIGRILQRLRDLGIEDNTLVMFLSDNGGCAEELDFSKPGSQIGDPGCDVGYGVGWANVANTPFRLFKRDAHEGGIATPFIISWPARIARPAAVTHDVGHIIDILPTCLEAADAQYPATLEGKDRHPPEGRSVLPALWGKKLPAHESLCWEHEGNRAIRQGKWKLVSRYLRPWELYDMEADRTEINDLAARRHDLVESLAAAYERWARRCGVVQPHELPPRVKVREKDHAPVLVKTGEPQLFVDDAIIAEASGLVRTLHPPRKDNNGETPVISPMPGSATLMAKGSILWDPQLKKHVMFAKDLPSTDLYRLTSTDGFNWTGENGPMPDRVEIDRRHPVTRQRAERHQAGMHCLHYDAANREYPYQGWIYFGNWGPEYEGVYHIRSRDGIRWDRGKRVVEGYAGLGDLSALRVEMVRLEAYGPGDTTRFAHDPATGRFLGIFKFFTTNAVIGGNQLRSRAYMFLDGLDRPVPYKQLEAVNLLPPAVATDNEGPADEYYESTAWRYGPQWLGELLVWHRQDDYPYSAAGCSFIRLVSSRDGLRWQKLFYPAESGPAGVFVATGKQGGNDGRNDGGHMSLFSQGPLRINDELIFYYGASSWGKTAPDGRRVTGGGIFRARLRVDGFVSVDAGSLITRPLTFEGENLFVNAVGPIAVEVLDQQGAPLGTASIQGDSLAHPLTFDGRTLKQFAATGNTQLCFRIAKGGRLYSFTVR